MALAVAPALAASACARGAAELPLEPVPARFEVAALGRDFARRADSLYRAGAYADAAQLFLESTPGATDCALPWFRAARAWSMAGRLPDALRAMRAALASGLRGDSAQMARDTTLAAIHNLAEWPRLVAGAERNRTAYLRERSDPERARLVTSDIDHFWHAYDIAARLATHDDRVQA
jgi:hypothetical protein